MTQDPAQVVAEDLGSGARRRLPPGLPVGKGLGVGFRGDEPVSMGTGGGGGGSATAKGSHTLRGGEGEGGERAGDGAVRQWGGGRAMANEGNGAGGLGLDEQCPDEPL